MTTPELTPADHAAVASASRLLYARYRDFVAYEDVQQECYLWLFQKYDRALRWREQHGERHAERTLVKALRNAGERYCRAERAEWSGYEPEDEFFYSLPMVADLLALSFDPDWMIPGGVQLDAPRSGKAASEGGNLMAMVADVTRAYGQMAEHDRELLARVYGHGVKTSDALAELSLEWEVSMSAANSRVRRVVGRLRAALGGPSPYREEE